MMTRVTKKTLIATAEHGAATTNLDPSRAMSERDLDQALEDTFPASDPINFAGAIPGSPANRPEADASPAGDTEARVANSPKRRNPTR